MDERPPCGRHPLCERIAHQFVHEHEAGAALREQPCPRRGFEVVGSTPDALATFMQQQSQASARLVVIGDSDFISDQFIGTGARAGLRDYLANLVYTMNIIDWLAQDEALAAVRKKGMQSRPLDQVAESTVTMVKLLNIGALPGLILLIGLVRFRLRQSARQSAKL